MIPRVAERVCARQACGRPLVRRAGESPRHWAKRMYCCQDCQRDNQRVDRGRGECLRCGQSFARTKSRARYCSRTCHLAHLRERAVPHGEGVCPECQRSFPRRSPDQVCCSKRCANRARNRARYSRQEHVVDGQRVAEVKACAACGRRFPKPKGTTWRKWADRRYCTARCGQGAPRVKPPVPVRSLRADMWRELAACRDADPGLFAPPDAPGQVDWPIVTRVAQRWCQGCPVKQACLDDALAARTWGCGLRGGVMRYYKGGTVHQIDLLALADEFAGVAS